MKFLEYMDFVFVYMTFIWGQNKGSKRGILVEQKGHGATNEMTTKIKLDGLLHLFKTLGICQKVRSISGLLIMEGGLIQSIYLWHPTDGFLTHMRFPHTSTSLLKYQKQTFRTHQLIYTHIFTHKRDHPNDQSLLTSLNRWSTIQMSRKLDRNNLIWLP
ncbi:hypothetical protein YC2023_062853 [Brassica napus]